MKHSLYLTSDELKKKAKKDGLKNVANRRIPSPLDKIINTKEKAERFMKLLRDA